jgi:hypothetical protein
MSWKASQVLAHGADEAEMMMMMQRRQLVQV